MDELSLVTGGAGFIGSHLVEELVRRGRPVRVFDDFSTGLRSNLAKLDPSPEVVEGSLTDPSAVARAVRGAGTIYHLGALASVARSVENPVATHAACATGTLNLLDAARKAGVRRIVYAASSSAYGGVSKASGQSAPKRSWFCWHQGILRDRDGAAPAGRFRAQRQFMSAPDQRVGHQLSGSAEYWVSSPSRRGTARTCRRP